MSSKSPKNMAAFLTLLSFTAFFTGCGAAVEADSPEITSDTISEQEATIQGDSAAHQQSASFLRTPSPQEVEAAARQKEASLKQQQADLVPEKEVANSAEISAEFVKKPIELISAAPVEVVEIPVKAIEVPVEVVEVPVEAIEVPVEAIEVPVEVVEAPVEAIEAPVEVVKTPVEFVKPSLELIPTAPLDVTETPIEKVEETVEELFIIGEIEPEEELRVVGDFLVDSEKLNKNVPQLEDSMIEDIKSDLPNIDLQEPVLGSVLLGWDQNFAFNTGEILEISDIDGFEIAYGADPNELSQTIAVEDPKATEYRIPDLAPGELYFAVRVVTKSGATSPYSNQVFAAVK